MTEPNDRIFLNPSFIDGETAEDREHRLIHWTLDHPLTSKWCDCDGDTGFRCYPADGECECGIFKHHVHGTCGHVYATIVVEREEVIRCRDT